MKSDPAKVQALQDLPIHDNQMRLQSFLSLVTYLQPFMPGLTNKTIFLHEQLAEWDLNASTIAAFQHFKSWICSTLVKTALTFYDRTQPVIVKTDAYLLKM